MLRTNRALVPFMSAGGTEFSSKVDDLEMRLIPLVLRDKAFEIVFGLFDALPV